MADREDLCANCGHARLLHDPVDPAMLPNYPIPPQWKDGSCRYSHAHSAKPGCAAHCKAFIEAAAP